MFNMCNELADLLNKRNKLDDEISRLIGRPAEKGHIGEYIASRIFKIKLEVSASNKAFDGCFLEGTLKNKTVNIKWYSKKENLIDINPDGIPDYFLILTGEEIGSNAQGNATRPLVIQSVFLFNGIQLVESLKLRGVKVGVASSVAKEYWDLAVIYPKNINQDLLLGEDQENVLKLFSPRCLDL